MNQFDDDEKITSYLPANKSDLAQWKADQKKHYPVTPCIVDLHSDGLDDFERIIEIEAKSRKSIEDLEEIDRLQRRLEPWFHLRAVLPVKAFELFQHRVNKANSKYVKLCDQLDLPELNSICAERRNWALSVGAYLLEVLHLTGVTCTAEIITAAQAGLRIIFEHDRRYWRQRTLGLSKERRREIEQELKRLAAATREYAEPLIDELKVSEAKTEASNAAQSHLDLPKTASQKIEEFCKSEAFTLTDLANAAGISERTLLTFRNDPNSVKPDTVRSIAKVLGITTHELLN